MLVNLNKIKLDKLEIEDSNFYNKIFVDREKSEQALQDLGSFFNIDASPKKDREYLIPQFKWYTDLFWRDLTVQDESSLLNIAVSRQIPAALFLGHDVLRELMWYFVIKTSPFIENERENLYSKIKNKFFDSGAIIGEYKGEVVTVKEIIEEIRHIEKIGTSLDIAEFQTKLKSTLFPKSSLVTRSFSSEPDSVVTRFRELVEFFSTISNDEINLVVEDFIHPEIELADEEKTNFSFKEIRSKIESSAKKDGQGQFMNLEDVFLKLDKFAEENNDERIRDLFYFNEKTGKFEWNEDLLKEASA